MKYIGSRNGGMSYLYRGQESDSINIRENSNNVMKSTWKVISELTDDKKHTFHFSLEQNSTVIEDPQQIAQIFHLFLKNAPNKFLNEIKFKINSDEDNSQHICIQRDSFVLEYA